MTVLTKPQTRRIPLYGWLTAEAISLLGTRVSMIAIPWLVLTTTGSATQTGLVAFAEITPMVFFKAFGGPLVDRVGPRRMAITVDLLSFVAVGMIPLLHHSGALTFPTDKLGSAGTYDVYYLANDGYSVLGGPFSLTVS